MGKINLNVIREGDVFFTKTNSLVGNMIRLFRKSKVEHVGQFIKPYGGKLVYRCEMVQDWLNDNDLKFNPIKEDQIVSIKRPIGAYNTQYDRQLFRRRMIELKEGFTLLGEPRSVISYDMRELFSFLSGKADKNKTAKICSRLVYDNLIEDGCNIKSDVFDHAIAPDNLFNSPLLQEVEGWKIG